MKLIDILSPWVALALVVSLDRAEALEARIERAWNRRPRCPFNFSWDL